MKDETVLMNFPRPVGVIVSTGSSAVDFKEGLQRVPKELAEHPHLLLHGVTLYEEEPTEVSPEPEDSTSPPQVPAVPQENAETKKGSKRK